MGWTLRSLNDNQKQQNSVGSTKQRVYFFVRGHKAQKEFISHSGVKLKQPLIHCSVWLRSGGCPSSESLVYPHVGCLPIVPAICDCTFAAWNSAGCGLPTAGPTSRVCDFRYWWVYRADIIHDEKREHWPTMTLEETELLEGLRDCDFIIVSSWWMKRRTNCWLH